MSISGGLHTAPERALKAGCTTFQMFVKNSNQWEGKPITDEDVSTYQSAVSNARFELVPKILETPKSDDLHEDIENLARLRSLIERNGPSRSGNSSPGERGGKRGTRRRS